MARPDYHPGLRSRFVSYLKVALPLLAIALLSTVFLFQVPDEIEGGITFSADDRDTIRDGLTIYNPKFSGVNLNGDRFFMEASKATPDSAEPEEVALLEINGRTDYVGGFSVYLKAARGTVHLPDQQLNLSGGIHIRTSEGFEGLTNSGQFEMDTGRFVTATPVSLNGPMGQVEAGSLRIETLANGSSKENQVFTFENGVKLTLTPN